MCKISQGIQIFDQNFHYVLWFMSYSQKYYYVKTKVVNIFPVPEKQHENKAKMKVTMIILGISSASHYLYHPNTLVA